NVILLLADDLGWKDIGCYGGPVKTPALDSLAARGMRFTDFHSGAAVCSPSRATLLTGRHHVRTGVYSWINDNDQDSHLLESETTLAEILKGQGYETAHFGKWHLGFPLGKRKKPSPSDHGFDYWYATVNGAGPSHRNPNNFIRNGEKVGQQNGYSCHLVVDEAIRWLDEERKSDTPFFLNIWFHEPHAPIAAPDEIVVDYGKTNDAAAIYSGTIDNTDQAIDRLLLKLEKTGALENTLIVYSSDNGSYRQDRVGPLREKKGSNYEGGTRVPGIFFWKGKIPAGKVEDEPAGLIDIVPTVCGILEIDPPESKALDGSDLTPLLTGGQNTIKRQQPLTFISPLAGSALALREGKYSLIGHKNGEYPRDRAAMDSLRRQIVDVLRKGGDPKPESTVQEKLFEGFANKEADLLRGQYIRHNQFHESWIPAIKAMEFHRFELYDLSKDISQKTDIAKEQPEVFERLKKQLLEIAADVIAEGPNWGNSSALPAKQKPKAPAPQPSASVQKTGGLEESMIPLIDASCNECHDEDTKTDLNFYDLAFNLSNPKTFRRWEKVFDQIDNGKMPPKKKARPDAELKETALDSLCQNLRAVSLAKQQENGRVPVRRLTRTEYEYTLHDLLGIGGDLASKLPPENLTTTFDTVASGQGISPVHIRGYLAAADLALDESIKLGPRPRMAPRFSTTPSPSLAVISATPGHTTPGTTPFSLPMEDSNMDAPQGIRQRGGDHLRTVRGAEDAGALKPSGDGGALPQPDPVATARAGQLLRQPLRPEGERRAGIQFLTR
ncbi:MAG: sulfatase-like hydrolase/transferase, partial [Rhodothermia bacterium]